MVGEASHLYCSIKLDRGAFCELRSARDLDVVQKCVSDCKNILRYDVQSLLLIVISVRIFFGVGLT
jgi:hypothetical protein